MAQYGLNKQQLIGNVGKYIQFRLLGEGTPQEQTVGKFSLCTSIPIGGGKTTDTWHQVVVYGPIAKAVAKHITQGKLLYIEGSWRNRKEVDQATGLERYWPETVVGGSDSCIRFLSSDAKPEVAAPDKSIEDAMAALIPGYKAPVTQRPETAPVDTSIEPDMGGGDTPVEHMNLENHGRSAMQDTPAQPAKDKKAKTAKTDESSPV